jgi:hypothetical protein
MEVNMAGKPRKTPRTGFSGDNPMTGSQASYLKTLSEQAHKPDPTAMSHSSQMNFSV